MDRPLDPSKRPVYDRSMTPAELGQFVTVLTGFLLLGLAGYGLASLRFRVPGTGFFVALTLAGAIWSFGYAWEKTQTTVDGFMAAIRVEYLGLAFVPTLWLLVALNWIEHRWGRSRGFQALALGYSVVVLALVWTNPWHHWWYSDVVLTGRVGFARFIPGPLYYSLLTLYLSTLILTVSVVVARRHEIPQYRQRATVIIAGNLIPVLADVAYQTGFRPSGLDITLFSLVPAFSLVAWGLFRHDLIRLLPIAWPTVINSLDQAVLVFDPTGRLVDRNRAAEDVFPLLPEAWRRADGPSGDCELAADPPRTLRVQRKPVSVPGGAVLGTVAVFSDVTAERLLMRELSHQATHDALTGLPNRRYFVAQAESEVTRALRQGAALSLVLFDLDHFKLVNDRHGHATGDRVLTLIASVLTPRLRPYDLMARLGGEEFAVLMPGAQAREAREAADRWRQALEGTPGPEGLVVTASFGVCSLEDLPSTPTDPAAQLDALLARADAALYRAKSEGRNRVV